MPEVEDLELEDEKYLSAATLARLKEMSAKEKAGSEEPEEETETVEASEESTE